MSGRPTTRKEKLPKSIGLVKGRYRVILHAKKDADSDKKTIYVGAFGTLEEAIVARDKFIIENYSGVTKDYMPRGIAYVKRQNSYQANLSIDGTTFYIGTYKTLSEAIEGRNKYIDSLK